MELAQDRVQWWALVLAVLNRCVLLPQSWLAICNVYSDSHETAVQYQYKLQVYAIFQQDIPSPYQCSMPSGTLHTALFQFNRHFFNLCRNATECVTSQACVLLQQAVNKVTADYNKCIFFLLSEFQVSAQDL